MDMNEASESFLLSCKELCILLQMAGCRTWFGFPAETEPVSEEETLRILYGMVRKGFLCSDGEAFHVEARLSEALKQFKNAKETLVVEDGRQSLPAYCCYLDEKILVSEWMSQRKQAVKWKLCRRDQLFSMLVEEGYIGEMNDFQAAVYENPGGKKKRSICTGWKGTARILNYEEDAYRETVPYSMQQAARLFRKIINDCQQQQEWRCL